MIAGGLFSEIYNTLFPPLCLGCQELLAGGADEVFCQKCRPLVSYLTQSHCPVCGTVYPDSPAFDHLCGRCLDVHPDYDAARAVCTYEGVILEAIHKFKYGRNITAGSALARLLVNFKFPDIDIGAYDLIVPVPLHIQRLRRRGFNQSLILAQSLAEKYQIELDFSILKRKNQTSSQTGLDKKERAINVRGAFLCVCPEKLRGKNVIIVDDVYTTGATLNECAQNLKKAGADRVVAVTLARVP